MTETLFIAGMRKLTRIIFSISGFVLFAIIILNLTVVASLGKTVVYNQVEVTMQTKSIEEVLQENSNKLMSIPGVVGTGQGLCNGMPCIKVFVIKKTPELDQKIPDVLEGYPVVVEETGMFRAL